jgi:hypothetical protein
MTSKLFHINSKRPVFHSVFEPFHISLTDNRIIKFLLVIIPAILIHMIIGCSGEVTQQSNITVNDAPEKKKTVITTQKCWLVSDDCPDDNSDFIYFVGIGSGAESESAGEVAEILSRRKISNYISTTIEAEEYIKTVCRGSTKEDSCIREHKRRILIHTANLIARSDYDIDDYYYDSQKKTFYLRIRIKISTAHKMLKAAIDSFKRRY